MTSLSIGQNISHETLGLCHSENIFHSLEVAVNVPVENVLESTCM